MINKCYRFYLHVYFVSLNVRWHELAMVALASIIFLPGLLLTCDGETVNDW